MVKRCSYIRQRNNEQGAALIIFFMVMVVLSILFVAFMSRSISDNRATVRLKDTVQAYFLAEAGIDQAKRELYDLFQVYYMTQGRRTSAFTWFDDLVTDPTGKYAAIPTDATLANVPNGSYSVQITAVDTATTVPKDITIQSSATVNGITKTMTAVVRYSMSPSKVFDYSYFINNYGWFWGGTITSQGDVRSNADFSFQSGPRVNGDVYASINPDLGAAGAISGTNGNQTIAAYRTAADSTARPTNPTANAQDINGDGILETFAYANGYDGASDKLAAQQLLDMPYLGDLDYYKDLAVTKNGTISQGGTTLVDNVLTGNVVLIGTAANPIVINGPVVVTGDVVIKGKVTGQGTLYSGRNTHIVGNIEYVNASAWPKPDIDPTATDAANAAKDFIGLASRGNVVIGDYTSSDWTTCKGYLKPPFTQAYKVDTQDSVIGYVSYTSGGDAYFNGDYTAYDGGTKTDGSNRRYYESSYDNTYIHSVSDAYANITRVDAVTYTNHAFTGRVNNFQINGTIISRDEAVVYSNYIKMNYDVRAKDKGEEFYLPRALSLPHTQYLKKD